MARDRRSDQFSIAALLWATLGVAIFLSLAPRLYATSRVSPAWTVCVLIVLLFSWCMVPIRRGAARAWWWGFLVFGSLYLVVGVLVQPEEHLTWLPDRVGEVAAALAMLPASMLLVLGFGVLGGILFRRMHQHR